NRRRDELPDGVYKDWRVVQQHELLAADARFFRRTTTHSRTKAGRGDDNRNFHSLSCLDVGCVRLPEASTLPRTTGINRPVRFYITAHHGHKSPCALLHYRAPRA